jgi:hypothetical protein
MTANIAKLQENYQITVGKLILAGAADGNGKF